MAYRTDTLCGLFHNQALRYGDKFPFLTARFDKEGRPIDHFTSRTWKDAREEVIDLARGLIAAGVKRGDRVVIFSESRPRWIIADQAIQACGAIGVPLYPTLAEEELAYMLQDSESRVVIISTQDKARMTIKVTQGKESPIIIQMCPWDGRQPDGVYTFAEVMALGAQMIRREAVEEAIGQVKPDDIASIIYTSGTTGKPKGVVLTQANWVANMHQCTASEIIQRTKALDLHLKALVHLPLCHVFGRTSDFHSVGLVLGGELVFAESYQSMSRDLREVRPQVIDTIPRLFEKIYEIVQSTTSRTKPQFQAIYKWAMGKGKLYVDSLATGKRMAPHQLLLFSLANILVFERLKKQMGLDRVVLAISGGGKLAPEICTFFRALGIQLSEGYGLTETSPVINFSAPELYMQKPQSGIAKVLYDWIMRMTTGLMVEGISKGKSPYLNPISALKLGFCYYTLVYNLRVKPGFVGRTMNDTEEKIAEDGEILVKGPQVFKTYWKKPQDTADSFTPDGYFKTGDIGQFDSEGFLQITDRKKELFVTSGGKNVAPCPIEAALTARPYIDQVCLIGEGRKYLTALIVPDIDFFTRYARNQGLDAEGLEELFQRDEIRDLIRQQVEQVNQGLARYEQIKEFHILHKPFDVSSGELTPTLKLKRRAVYEHYQAEIDGMYARWGSIA